MRSFIACVVLSISTFTAQAEGLADLEGTWNIASQLGCKAQSEDNSIRSTFTITPTNEENESYQYFYEEEYFIGSTVCTPSTKATQLTRVGHFYIGAESSTIPEAFILINDPSSTLLKISKSSWVAAANGHDWQNGGFCGLNDWEIGVEKDITGRSCSIGTTIIDTTLAKITYDIIKISKDGLVITLGSKGPQHNLSEVSTELGETDEFRWFKLK